MAVDRQRVRGRAGVGFRAVRDQRGPDEATGYVSLRVTAKDAAGDTVEQEVERAFGIAPRG